MLAIILLFFAGIVWVNFFGRQWYNMDMYTDAYLVKLMAQSNTIFPEGWIFGNQYYGFATPPVAALIYKIFPDSFYAMAIASTLMTIAVLALFVWCLRRFCSRTGVLVGVFGIFCLVFGNHAASCYWGMQVFYTMASYYACYLIGIFVTLGCYLRLRFKQPCKAHFLFIMWLSALLLNYLLGMNSPRELLVLNLPLLAIEILREGARLIKKQKIDKASIIFAAATTAAGLMGRLTVKLLNIKSCSMFNELGAAHSARGLRDKLLVTLNALLEAMGLKFFEYDLRLIPLSLMALVVLSVVITALVQIIKRRDNGALATCVMFCCVSLAAVAAAGVLVIPVRQIYFFVWFVLAAFCMAYMYEIKKDSVQKANYRVSAALLLLCLFGLTNFAFNFIPCVNNFFEKEELYTAIEQRIENDGIKTVWVFPTTSPTAAMYSNDKISAGTIEINTAWTPGGNEKPLRTIEYLCEKQMYDSDGDYVYLLSSDWDEKHYYTKFSEQAVKALKEQMKFVEEYSSSDMSFTLYKLPKELLTLELFETM